MAKPSLNYPRYRPNPLRPPGAGAFFDFAAGVASRSAPKLKSCSLTRHWERVPAAPERVYIDTLLDAFDDVRR